VLKGVNLTINPGEKFAIMGATGCGKSTLVNLIPRFYDVTGGQILVDGVDVREYKQETLRDKVASALQKAELFGISVSDNIRWGKQDATQEEIVEAAKTAQADEFIREMPEQYDSIVAERGMSLSGGQRQRMSIARTVLKDAEIYIFDDSTSALDLKTEAAFYRALEGSHPDSTKIIVAQRIASVMNADRIAIIEDGKIYACASHEELLETCEIYQNIYNSQMGGGRANG
ncbi:MAG: ATP-binding cassette domain-containing protein, partial [Lachnospiraceae bacterium]|nr:ATP-binding cassette domain-containing protein [Lachnospiraceae bacterium]